MARKLMLGTHAPGLLPDRTPPWACMGLRTALPTADRLAPPETRKLRLVSAAETQVQGTGDAHNDTTRTRRASLGRARQRGVTAQHSTLIMLREVWLSAGWAPRRPTALAPLTRNITPSRSGVLPRPPPRAPHSQASCLPTSRCRALPQARARLQRRLGLTCQRPSADLYNSSTELAAA